MANTPRPLAPLIERIEELQEAADALTGPHPAVRVLRLGLQDLRLQATEKDLQFQFGMAAMRNGPGSERVRELASAYEARFGGRRARA